MTKHTPATPLPWTTGQMPARWPERDQMYAAFAANAYPKLVEKSRALYDSLQGRLNTLIQHTATPGEKEAYRKAREDFRALLRELGEE